MVMPIFYCQNFILSNVLVVNNKFFRHRPSFLIAPYCFRFLFIFYTCVLLSPFLFSFLSARPFHCYWFTYTGLEIPFNLVFTNFFAKQKDAEELFITNILNLLQKNSPLLTAKADLLFANKLINWVELFSTKATTAKQVPIEAIVTYINQNLSLPHLLQDVSNHFAYCEKHVRNIFKKNMGGSPKQYILNTKINLV